ncbi:uncharacterized protein CTHT_0074190 [Thermochaetoides thermophila DSM 1495]|uniref:Structure-specific endonuclease subunit SLX4 n=1 Tax=Chaetomium thermophilum (strain DSM 1495 / CBS 144.50 / IMI 039719) TaxID=759272 RepID=G0SI20_CHATD|nr:hypothetical protein CTHT_0074190 [Thermochaetoides thermophila DSM 1495]EGS17090.1 hypothetical protein CTHT_0074190 [Thermochaetoides thermophila DSM 1495]
MIADQSPIVISSSPDFPLLPDLPLKSNPRPFLRDGGHAASIPDDAPQTLTSAAKTWQSSGSGISDESMPIGRGKAPITQTAQNAIILDSEDDQPQTAFSLDSLKADSQPASRKVDVNSMSDASRAMAQEKLSNGMVTKPSAKDSQSRKQTETVSRHFAPAPQELALARRLDWTPPRDLNSVLPPLDSSTTKEVFSPEEDGRPSPKEVFRNLQDTFGLKEDDLPRTDLDAAPARTEVLGKRKLIEMGSVSSMQPSPEASPTKPRIKKKQRTLTELATAAYRVSEDSDVAMGENGPKQGSMLSYLNADKGASTEEAKTVPKKPTKRAIKPRGNASRKKQEPPKPVLLSPQSALKEVSRQDFVFGTASQLALEDDPELLRAVHEAMKISNQTDSDPFTGSSPVTKSNLAIRKRPGTGLWAAGARDENGDLVDLEEIDLTASSPSLDRLLCSKSQENNAARSFAVNDRIELLSDDSSEFPDVSSVIGSISAAAPVKDLSQPASPNGVSKIVIDSDNFPDVSELVGGAATSTPPSSQKPAAVAPLIQIDDSEDGEHVSPEFEPPPSNQEQLMLLSQSRNSAPSQSQMPPRPNFELYTDARLAKEVSSYGFKAIKKREAMIALLNQCWESKHKVGLGSRLSQVSMSITSANLARKKQSSAASSDDETPPEPPKKRGRPRKSSTSTTSEAAKETKTTKKKTTKTESKTRKEAEGEEEPEPEKKGRGRPKKTETAEPAESKAAKASTTKATKKSAATKTKAATTATKTTKKSSKAQASKPAPEKSTAASTEPQPEAPPEVEPIVEIVDSELGNALLRSPTVILSTAYKPAVRREAEKLVAPDDLLPPVLSATVSSKDWPLLTGTAASITAVPTAAATTSSKSKTTTTKSIAKSTTSLLRRKSPTRTATATAAETTKTKTTSSGARSKSPTHTTTATTPRRRKSPMSVIEIADSESEGSLSSPKSEIFSSLPPEGMDLSVTEETDDTSLVTSPTTRQLDMFKYITEAVTSAPPSTDVENPSWHEKMLMFDPIIIEELTAWLNSGQLARVGYVGEVAPEDVKKWCETYVPFFSNVVFSVIASNGSVVKNGAAGPISPDLRLQDSGADKRGTLRQKRPQQVLSRVPRLTPTS